MRLQCGDDPNSNWQVSHEVTSCCVTKKLSSLDLTRRVAFVVGRLNFESFRLLRSQEVLAIFDEVEAVLKRQGFDSGREVGVHKFWSCHDAIMPRTKTWHSKLIPPFQRLAEQSVNPFEYVSNLTDRVADITVKNKAKPAPKLLASFKDVLGHRLNDISLMVRTHI